MYLPDNMDLDQVGFICLLWPGITGKWGASVYRADGRHLAHLHELGDPLDADIKAREFLCDYNDRLHVAVITLRSQAAIPPVLDEVVARLHAPMRDGYGKPH